MQILMCSEATKENKNMKYYINRPTSAVTGMEALFNDIFGDGTFSRKIPPVDVYEIENGYVIEAEVAGYKQEEISLSVEKHVLTIASEHLEKANGENEEDQVERRFIMKEISRPDFTRSFTLPEDVDEEKIEAETKDGVLKVFIPKMEKAQKGKIQIQIK